RAVTCEPSWEIVWAAQSLTNPPCRQRASVAKPLVHDVEERLAGRVAAQVLDEEVDAALANCPARGGVVRRDQHVGQVPEGAVGPERLLAVGVEAGAGDPALPQRPQ